MKLIFNTRQRNKGTPTGQPVWTLSKPIHDYNYLKIRKVIMPNILYSFNSTNCAVILNLVVGLLPFNKRYTGPLPKFINMIKSENYKMLLNHLDSEIIEIFKADEKYGFEVKILGRNKNYYKFQWIVEKYSNEGPLKDCWLTTSVSNPISLGSSI